MNDEKGNGLYNVQIKLRSKGNAPYYTGISGAFGIPLSVNVDTITLQIEGYETLTAAVVPNKYLVFSMKPLMLGASVTKYKRLSFTKDDAQQKHLSFSGDESYSTLVENEFMPADKYPETGFVMNVDKASYSNIRRFLNNGSRVPPDAVRTEELLNYFSINADTVVNNTKLFLCNTKLTSCPWNNNNRLLYINLNAPSLALDDVPPCNLIFLIDVSGSMDEPNRLPMLKEAFKLLAKNLRAKDSVAIVVYGGVVGIMLQPTSGSEKDKINNAIEKLQAGGETPGEAAIISTYSLAEKCFNKNANNRIILATDGDFNVGQTSDKELEDLISKERQSGISLTCLGVGMGNYKDSKLEILAKKGNGNFAYLDNLNEAEKTLVIEFTKTLYTVAHNAYASVKFNAAHVKSYRLLGFDNTADALADTSSALEGGEVGTGHSLLAVFEIVPNESDTLINTSAANYGTLTLDYQLQDSKNNQQQNFEFLNNYKPLNNADSAVRFATSVIMFAEALKQSEYSKNYTIDDVIKLASSSANVNDYSQSEFLQLLQKARKIYGSKKQKKKKVSAETLF